MDLSCLNNPCLYLTYLLTISNLIKYLLLNRHTERQFQDIRKHINHFHKYIMEKGTGIKMRICYKQVLFISFYLSFIIYNIISNDEKDNQLFFLTKDNQLFK